GYCASTSPRAPTCPDGPPRKSRRSLTHSTRGPVRPSAGKLPPRPSTSNYYCSNEQVLHPPIESGQFRSRRFAQALKWNGLVGSMGRVASASDNAAKESFFALLQKNLLNRQTWDSREQLRSATTLWIERNYHRKRRQ